MVVLAASTLKRFVVVGAVEQHQQPTVDDPGVAVRVRHLMKLGDRGDSHAIPSGNVANAHDDAVPTVNNPAAAVAQRRKTGIRCLCSRFQDALRSARNLNA